MNKHKQQIFWQIFFPMLLVIGLFAFFTFSFFGKTQLSEMDLRIWSDISLLIMLLPLFITLIFAFFFMFMIIYLIFRYQSAIGSFFSNIGDISLIASHQASKYTNYFIHPLIQLESIISQLLPQKKDKNKNG